jgi:hypothetical protein
LGLKKRVDSGFEYVCFGLRVTTMAICLHGARAIRLMWARNQARVKRAASHKYVSFVSRIICARAHTHTHTHWSMCFLLLVPSIMSSDANVGARELSVAYIK